MTRQRRKITFEAGRVTWRIMSTASRVDVRMRSQLEGACVMGLGNALPCEITFMARTSTALS